jgi:hypothetical protein
MPSSAVLYDAESAAWLRFGNLVRRRVIGEAVISREDLQKSRRIYLVNAVRKWRKAELLPD